MTAGNLSFASHTGDARASEAEFGRAAAESATGDMHEGDSLCRVSLASGSSAKPARARGRARCTASPDHPGRSDPHRRAGQPVGEIHHHHQQQEEPSKARSSNITRLPTNRLLWVDENGLTERGKAVMAEIEQGRRLRASRLGLRAAEARRVHRLGAKRHAIGSPTPRSRSAMPCSATRAMRAAAGSTPRGSLPISIRPRSAQSVRGDRDRSPFARIQPPICGASSRTSRNSRRSGRS